MSDKEYFERFFEEKELEEVQWFIEHNGTTHIIDNQFVISVIKNASPAEQKQIRGVLVRIDFANGDVNHFLEHLARGYVAANY